ncbi:deoxynucleoside kinase [Priestia endophytica]|jgi:deoxyguanosine kinase|uniref:Deoxyguanosine kinase n=1 Tax=Priestia endophytica DSM 13796 TaxID=1121089 RepID=A0A1I6C889_9BACI|nr:deoxynucleoside kinase [Priestia endophytica]KYG29142.1 deoxyguanosine kinase [Priestia endophytica]RAS71535.1 deoxynucleoside kinase [Priestia endophytica]SFQ89377.1 deoxyguanosine kinase [Priestia endophytica DSM 13796]
MNSTPFIAVEGPIGVGKTSLSHRLATYLQFHLLREIVEENPFLKDFYQNIDEWSFQTEMFFLCNRYKQLEDLEARFLTKQKPVVADYHVLKNIVFAKRTLHMKHYDKYERVYKVLTEDLPMPNIIIYLNASLETLLKRISKRGRDIEQDIDHTYLLNLKEDYEKMFVQFKQEHPHIPVFEFDGDKIDFVNREEDFQYIIDILKPALLKEFPNEFKR